MKELSARVKAVLRRYDAHNRGADEEQVRYDNIEISLQRYELKIKGKSIDVPPKELELLYFLASNCNRVPLPPSLPPPRAVETQTCRV